MMGCGKTRTGRILAARLGRPMLDLDEVIVERTGQSIAEIFELHGESYFRSLEAEAMNDLLELSDSVIAAGGGTPCHHDLLARMNDSGITIYLAAEPRIIAERLDSDEYVRPLLADMSMKETENLVAELLEERRPIYERSAYQVDANRTSEEIVQTIEGIIRSLQSK